MKGANLFWAAGVALLPIVGILMLLLILFGQLIMERTPGFHRRIRHFYDTYGYSISRHINHAWSADITYIIMKPLEWVFLLVLYLFDEKPEDRICSQYLPMEKII